MSYAGDRPETNALFERARLLVRLYTRRSAHTYISKR